jgi:glycosyltransferase involved in cell wall biosynthesis
MPDGLPVSVIVPVYEDWDRVPGLLDCLAQQSLQRQCFEVLLVDNGSTTCRPPAAHALRRTCVVRVLNCTTPGSYAARNHGIRNARGHWFAFTDADCRPEREWLESGLAALRADALVAGAVRMIRDDEQQPITAAERFDLVTGLPQARYVRRGYATTANLCSRREVLEAVGLFDQARHSGGDAEICRRARRAGFGLRYSGKALVCHPARRRLADLVGKIHRIKGGQLTAGPAARRLAWTLRACLPPVHDCVRLVRVGVPGLYPRIELCAVRGRLWFAEIAATARLLSGAPPRRR